MSDAQKKSFSEADFENHLMCEGNITDLLRLQDSTQKVVVNAASEELRLIGMGGTAGALGKAGVKELSDFLIDTDVVELTSEDKPRFGLAINDTDNIAKYFIQKHTNQTSILHIQAPRYSIGSDDQRLALLEKTADNVFDAAIKLSKKRKKNIKETGFTLYVNAVGSGIFGNEESYEYLLRSYFKKKQELDGLGIKVQFTYFDPNPKLKDRLKSDDNPNYKGWKDAFAKIKNEVQDAYDVDANASANADESLSMSSDSSFDPRVILGGAGWTLDSDPDSNSNYESNKYTKSFDVTSSISKDDEPEPKTKTVRVTAEVTDKGSINLSSESMEATVLAALDLMAKDDSLVPDIASLGEDDRKKYQEAFNSLKKKQNLDSYQSSGDSDEVKNSAFSRFEKALERSESFESISSTIGGVRKELVEVISYKRTVLDDIKAYISEKRGFFESSDDVNKLINSSSANKEDDVSLIKNILSKNPEHVSHLKSFCNLEVDFFRKHFGISSVSPEDQHTGNGASEGVVNEHFENKNAWITEVELRQLAQDEGVSININKNGSAVIKINKEQEGDPIELNYNGSHYELKKGGKAVSNAADGRCGYLAVAQALLDNGGNNIVVGKEEYEKAVSEKANELREKCISRIKANPELKQSLAVELLRDKASEVSFKADKAVDACAAHSRKKRNAELSAQISDLSN